MKRMDFSDLVSAQRARFATGRNRPLAFRLAQLERLQQMLSVAEAELLNALRTDLGKSPLEAYTTELGVVSTDIEHAVRRLAGWMRPRRVAVPPIAWPARACRVPEPLGVALIIGPWNYPLQLLLSPLVGALAAGNCVCLKPSEYAPRTAEVLSAHISRMFPREELAVVCGNADTAAALLREHFDTIFFTGSGRVGRQVMHAAAEHLTPVTLELGGKSPCIVCADARLDTAARRILWGKCLNAGQTCVSPDYLLVDRQVQAPLVKTLRAALDGFFPDGAARSPDYGRIVNRMHFERLTAYLAQGDLLAGGGQNAAECYIEPTLLGNVSPDAAVMQDEIFGPILPILTVDGIEAALDFVAARPRPLALYCFTESRATRARVIRASSSGGICFNDTITHIIAKQLPFGGVGASGMGQYHGKAGFDAFTHHKSVMTRATWIDPRLRYPPTRSSLSAMKKAYRFLVGR